MTLPPTGIPKKRRWSYLRWVLILALPALVAVVWFGAPWYEDWRIDRDLANAIVETDQLDPGWRFEELQAKRETIPDAANGALQILKVNAFFDKDGLYPLTFRDLQLPAGMKLDSPEHKDWLHDVYESFEDVDEAFQLNEQQIAALESEWKQHRQAIEEARKLRAYRDGRSPSKTSVDPITYKMQDGARNGGTLLFFDIQRLCQAEQFDEALDDYESILGIMCVMRHEPYRLANFRNAWLDRACLAMHRMLAQGKLDAKRLAQFQTLLEDEECFPHTLAVIRADRAESWMFFCQYRENKWTKQEREAYENPPGPIGEAKEKEPAWYLKWFKSKKLNDPSIRQAQELRRANRWIEFAKKPIETQWAGLEDFVKRQEKSFPAALFDGVARDTPRWLVVHTRLRTTRVAIALERYRQANGAWPKTLDQLVPDFVSEVPVDIYTGKPLLYRRVEQGVVIYSVGPDGMDNGGKLRAAKNEFVPFPDLPGLDIGVRLWDAGHRRQPALAPVLPRLPREDGL